MFVDQHPSETNARSELSVGELAEQTAESIRALNHLTLAADEVLTDPTETCDVVASLARAAGRLPQLLGQLSRWLVSENRAGKLRLDAWASTTDIDYAVTVAIGDLAEAAEAARRAGRALDAAHQVLAHLAAAADESDDSVEAADHDSATRARQAVDRNACTE